MYLDQFRTLYFYQHLLQYVISYAGIPVSLSSDNFVCVFSDWPLFRRAAFGWLALASLFFYGYWNPKYVFLISGSIIFNYVGGSSLGKLRDRGLEHSVRVVFALLIIVNLGLLAYFKYLMFLAGQFGQMFGVHWDVGLIVLPIGISFYTFTQIAYLADVAKGKVLDAAFLLTFCLLLISHIWWLARYCIMPK